MKWFGESWGAPICVPQDQVATPTGLPCKGCDHPIEHGERGVLISSYGTTALYVAYHLDCFLETLGIGRKDVRS